MNIKNSEKPHTLIYGKKTESFLARKQKTIAKQLSAI